MVRFILKPAYSRVAGARDYFSPETEFPLPVFRFFRGTSPHPSVQMVRGKLFFFHDFENPVLASNRRKLERRARARGARAARASARARADAAAVSEK